MIFDLDDLLVSQRPSPEEQCRMSHFRICFALGMTEEEIDQDWEEYLKDAAKLQVLSPANP